MKLSEALNHPRSMFFVNGRLICGAATSDQKYSAVRTSERTTVKEYCLVNDTLVGVTLEEIPAGAENWDWIPRGLQTQGPAQQHRGPVHLIAQGVIPPKSRRN